MGVSRPPGTGGGNDGAPLVIWGAGAMGGSIGAALVDAGHDVLFVDQDRDHVAAMNRDGLRITGPVVEATVPAMAVHPDQVEGTFSTILLCVKAHHTAGAVAQLAPHLADEGAVVSIQNGLCELEIADALEARRTIGAFVNFGADYLGPGVIHRGNRGAVVVGELDGADTPRIREIHGLLKTFEPDAVLTDNIFGFLWGKLAYAALLFATALTDESIADVLDSRSHRRLMRAIGREVVGVALARGVKLKGFDGFDPEAFMPPGVGAGSQGGVGADAVDVEPGSEAMSARDGADPAGSPDGSMAALDARTDASLDDLVSFNRASAKTHSGIWRDLAVRKRPTEVDAQLGAVVRIGKGLGVPTPLTEGIVRRIHEIERGERAQAWENLDELELEISNGMADNQGLTRAGQPGADNS
jgi:2-dehydropantoate 2-reductase